MPMIRDRDELRYNRDEREIRQLRVGRGLTRRQMNTLRHRHTGEGILDAIGAAGKWVSDNKKVIGDVVDTVGTVVKTGIQVKKELEDLERVKALRRAQEESFRQPKAIIKQPEKTNDGGDGGDDDVFSNLRLQAEQIKKGRHPNAMRKKGNGLFLN